MGQVRVVRPDAGRRFSSPITARPSQAVPRYRYPLPPPGSANGWGVETVYRRWFFSGLAG